MGFRVLLDGQPAVDDHGTDADVQGPGTVTEPRLYQLIRQHRPVTWVPQLSSVLVGESVV